jgi:hypothetical protein
MYLQMADESLNFYMNHFIDLENGGSYGETDNVGNPLGAALKGDLWKTAYHGTETSYYCYLYGNLYLNDGDVTLYYYFEPSCNDRVILMNPIPYNRELNGKQLCIQSVELNGKTYSKFSNGASRQLIVPAGVGGKFKVTYAVSDYSPTTIQPNFTHEGKGERYWVANTLGMYINSWELDYLEINGVDYSNSYVFTSTIPPNADGKYNIYYKGSHDWSHFETKTWYKR